jgi:hypothetical protein
MVTCPDMDSSRYDHLQRVVHITLYVDVSNAKALRERIVSCATSAGPEGDAERALLNFAFIDARLVSDLATTHGTERSSCSR